MKRGATTRRLFLKGAIVLPGMVPVLAAQKSGAAGERKESGRRLWFDKRLRASFKAKEQQAREFAKDEEEVAPEVWKYFEAGIKGDWAEAERLWGHLRDRSHHYERGKAEPSVSNSIWHVILDADLARSQFSEWEEKFVLAFGNDIIGSIPRGSIYFGGTDPGRGVVTALSKSHAAGDPFFTVTQNALADNVYLEYLRRMYGQKIHIPTVEETQGAFQEYIEDARRRQSENKLVPGEDVKIEDGRISISGQTAVMRVNALLVKQMIEKNPEKKFFIEESFPLHGMYPHLKPHRLIMEISRAPVEKLSEAQVLADRDYWTRYTRPLLGDWLRYDTPLATVLEFIEKTFVRKDQSGSTGDRKFLEDAEAQKAFSKLRSAIGGLYGWRAENSSDRSEKERMAREADYAYRQALALCPYSPELLYRYGMFLASQERVEEGIAMVSMGKKLAGDNEIYIDGLLAHLQELKSGSATAQEPKPAE